ncbi:Cro protein [Gordonia phage Vasanti]|uniref:Cro protein n=1 Tax=Gordonia phage Vasanti TaxID=2502431 RepID=A0A411BVZ4_9CAUD|nr:Cro protein [Gordonia phage Vasanti]QAY05780.1 Cro protein [Gordonia phage Vasanti]
MEVKDPAKLRRERKQKRYTQRELGMLVRRTQTTIYKLETGQLKNITEDLALAIAARLDCHWEDLFVAHEEAVASSVSVVSADGRVPA